MSENYWEEYHTQLGRVRGKNVLDSDSPGPIDTDDSVAAVFFAKVDRYWFEQIVGSTDHCAKIGTGRGLSDLDW